MVVGKQTLLASVVLPAADPGGVLFESLVRPGRLADVADLVRDGTDEDVDLGGVLAGASSLHGGPQSEVRSDGSTSSACAILRMVEKRGSTSSFSILESCF
jgi:hypothetical protein